MRTMLVMSMLLLAAGALFAQVAQSGGALMVNTPKGIYALRGGVLAHIDVATLKADKEMLLFDKMPAPPADGADNATRMAYFAEIQKRNAPALLLVKDNSLLIVIGDGFARVNQDTLKSEASASLKDPNEAPDPNQGRFVRQEPAPGYLLVGNTLFLMRSKEMMAINITDGKIITRAPLPADLQPVQYTGRGNGGGGGRGPGGGGNGGGGANPPANPPAN